MTACTSTTGTTDTVNVIFTVIRQVIVKYVRYGWDMQTTCSNIRRNENVDIATGEFIKDSQTFFLRHVTGQQTDTMAVCSKAAPDIFTTMLGVSKNNGAIWPLFFNQRLQ